MKLSLPEWLKKKKKSRPIVVSTSETDGESVSAEAAGPTVAGQDSTDVIENDDKLRPFQIPFLS